MTDEKEKLETYSDDVIFSQLDDLMKAANAPCENECKAHKDMFNLVRFLCAMVKSVFSTNRDIKNLMAEIREQQKEIIKIRKVGMWGIGIVGTAFLAEVGIFLWRYISGLVGG
jgi:hypothetical protein